MALKEDYQRALDEQKQEVREFVMAGYAGLQQAQLFVGHAGLKLKNKLSS